MEHYLTIMARKSIESRLPQPVRHAIREMGSLISAGRREKRFTQAELASRVGVGRMTVVRMEKGAPEVAIGYYLSAAWILGLPVLSWSDFAGLRANTSVAAYLEKFDAHLPERVRKQKDGIDNDF